MLLPDVSRRTREPELMDAPGLDLRRHLHALSALARVNVLSRVAVRIWPEVIRVHRARGSVRLLDVACGGGDVVVALLRRARRAGIDLEATGCDRSDVALEHARSLARRHGVPGEFVARDALSGELPAGFDVVCTSLFLHHMSDAEAAALLGAMSRAARHSLVVQDLRRTRVGYLLAFWLLRALSRSEVTHVDGPRSVRAAFTVQEAREIALRAGLKGAHVARCWPQRFVLTWRRT